ncbi:sugar-binding transcriptional regulator [Virgibacillus byunsanensis]|uniref:Sugar-binding transcriptional regulator n=1 Tax=Virgibacillus byunsanensis TaxID=570945 RepID=A0ABW3LK98_9BACI
MRDLVELQKKLYPDLLEVIQQRYVILNTLALFQPIGRRGLSERTNLTERNVRGEIDFLHAQGLVDVTTKGMHITKEGRLVIDQLADFMREITGLSVLEKQLQDKLHIENVMIVPGDSDQHDWVKKEMGKACISFLGSRFSTNQTIAVTGGTTMAAVADEMTPFEHTSHLFVPARGGIGEKVENQANTIVSKMAVKAKGDYRLLYVPDPLSETSYQTMIKEPSIIEVLQIIKDSDVILHGIGEAITMAKRRKTEESVVQHLEANQAVSEAFGYYFNENGDVVHKVRTIGIHLDDLASIGCVVTIAGGGTKGKAISSYFRQGKSNVLITDEVAAEQILRENSPLNK